MSNTYRQTKWIVFVGFAFFQWCACFQQAVLLVSFLLFFCRFIHLFFPVSDIIKKKKNKKTVDDIVSCKDYTIPIRTTLGCITVQSSTMILALVLFVVNLTIVGYHSKCVPCTNKAATQSNFVWGKTVFAKPIFFLWSFVFCFLYFYAGK